MAGQRFDDVRVTSTGLRYRSDEGDAMTLFEWLAAVCKELGWGVMRAHDLLDDTRWSDMFEAGLSPTQAAAQARANGMA